MRLGVDLGTLISLVPPEGDNRSEEVGGNHSLAQNEIGFSLGSGKGGYLS